MLPLPFGRGQIVWAGPVRVAKDAGDKEIERQRARLETLLD